MKMWYNKREFTEVLKRMDYKSYIAARLPIDGVSQQEIAELIAQPPTRDMGDYALLPFCKGA